MTRACGISGHFHGIPYTSGSGTLLSRDAVQIIRAALDRPIDLPGECEDVFMGQALHAAGVAVTPGAQRFDYWGSERRGPLPDVYHSRCKGLGPNGSRRDLEAFDDIHAMKLAKAVSG